MQQSNNISAKAGNANTRSNNSSASPTLMGGTSTEIEWRSVGNLSSGYTFSDPNSLLSSYSYNSSTELHTFNLVTVNPAVADYAINSAPNFTGPRWYRDLLDAGGSQVDADDRFNFFIRFSSFSVSGGLLQWGAYCGVSASPASTVLLTMQNNGQWMGVTGAGTPNTCVHTLNVASTVSLASATSARSLFMFGGLPIRRRVGGVVQITSAVSQDSVVRTDNSNFAGSGGLSLWLGCTTLGTVVTTGGSLSCKIDYAVVRSS